MSYHTGHFILSIISAAVLIYGTDMAYELSSSFVVRHILQLFEYSCIFNAVVGIMPHESRRVNSRLTAERIYLALRDDRVVLAFRTAAGGYYRCDTAAQAEALL